MYFASRMQAGRMLAARLAEKYRYEDCAVIAINDGGVVIGAQVAMQLHSVLMMLASKDITLPREIEAIGSIAQDGTFVYNEAAYSTGEIQELISEYFAVVEQQKFENIQELHHLIGAGGIIKKELIKGRNVILVTDGLKNGFSLDIAFQYLKPVDYQKLIIAAPLASVPAVDRMHILADDLCILSVIENYMDTSHYYDTQDIPDHTKIIETIEKIILNWK